MTGDGGNFGCEQTKDESILVRCPDRSVPTEERSSSAFLTAETQRTVDQAVDKPFESDGRFHKLAPKFSRHAVYHAARNHGLSDSGAALPLGSPGMQMRN